MRRFVLLAAFLVSACPYSSTDYVACTELYPGRTVDVTVGGSEPSQVELGALMEFGGVAATTSLELTSSCAEIASELGTVPDAIDAAFAPATLDARVTAMCKLASDALSRGHAPIALTTVTCTPFPATPACTAACSAAAAAKADCPEPPGVAQHFGPILAMRARLALMAASADGLSADIYAIHDIKGACIPYARDLVRDANAHVAASQKAIDALVSAAGGP